MPEEECSPRWSIRRDMYEGDRLLLNPAAMRYDGFFHDFVVAFGRLIFKGYRNVSGMESQQIPDTGMYYHVPKHQVTRRRCWCPELHKDSQKEHCPFLTENPDFPDSLFNPIGLGHSIRPCPDPSTCHGAVKRSRHDCRDVMIMAYNYMNWFIKYRVPLQICRNTREGLPNGLGEDIQKMFREYSVKSDDDDGLDDDPYWLWREAAVSAFVLELDDPKESKNKRAKASSVRWEEDSAWIREPLASLENGDTKDLLKMLHSMHVSSYNLRRDEKVDLEYVDLWTDVLYREKAWVLQEENIAESIAGSISGSISESMVIDQPNNASQEISPRNLKRPHPGNNSDDELLGQENKKCKYMFSQTFELLLSGADKGECEGRE